MMNFNEVGAHVSTDAAGHLWVNLGIYLPGIDPGNGYLVTALLINATDQFTPEIPAIPFAMTYSTPATYPLWSAKIDLTANAKAGTSFGQGGQYLYRFQLSQNGKVITNWFTDPYAREAVSGELGMFDTAATPFVWHDVAYKTPNLDDLIVYELQIEQFNTAFAGVIERLPYLIGLGVNCIELMPVTSAKQDFDWGYGPLHFLAPHARFGTSDDLRRLIDTCHQQGIAVIIDSVYQHVDDDFAYNMVYLNAGLPSPMISPKPVNPPPGGYFGPVTDFLSQFTQDYFLEINRYWLNEFHVDGFRYDDVAGYYDLNPQTKYGSLAYNTYQLSLPITRFKNPAGYSGILQVAEDLSNPQTILQQTYTVATWQNDLLGKCESMAMYNYVDEAFMHLLLLDLNSGGYPDSQTMNGVKVPVAPFQYSDSHDHSFLISFVGNPNAGTPANTTVFADRSKYYKLQPFVIALYTCRGVPMLWEGQEFGDDYVVPGDGDLRIHFQRDVNWQYFYDGYGHPLNVLYRKMAKLRRNLRALRSRDSFYYNVQSRPGDGIVGYHRHAPATATDAEQYAVVFLNFSDTTQTISIPFPRAGTYLESVDANPAGVGPLSIAIANDGDSFQLSVPSNYGYVYLKQ